MNANGLSSHAEEQKKRPDMARFEDTDRLWIEVDKRWATLNLRDTVTSPILKLFKETQSRVLARPADRPIDERKQIKFHLLVSSYYKGVCERP